MKTTMFASREATPAVSTLFRRLQVLTLSGLALSHGTNDAQKTMGVIAMGLLAGGYITSFYVPTWVILISALAIAFGTSLGGWRLIRTLGGKIFRIRPVHGFASQIAGAAVILSAALFGGPVSTTQVMSTSIIGVGAAQRINMVRWSVLQELLVAWVLTIPSNAALIRRAVLRPEPAWLLTAPRTELWLHGSRDTTPDLIVRRRDEPSIARGGLRRLHPEAAAFGLPQTYPPPNH